jgi:predicted nucleotidyltransferase
MSEITPPDVKIRWIIEDLKPYRPEKIILFGSLAKGDSDQYSDIDIVVIKRTNKKFFERIEEVDNYLREEFQGKIDIFVYTPEEFTQMKEEENPFIANVLENGKVIYEKTKAYS